MRSTKPLFKIDSPVALMTSHVFPEGVKGLDVDLLIFTSQFPVLIEFLRCITVPVDESHPRRYWQKNWRKFCRLWEIAQRLNGLFYLINYSTVPTEAGRCDNCGQELLGAFLPVENWNFSVLEVDMMELNEPSKKDPILTTVRGSGFRFFSDWITNLERL